MDPTTIILGVVVALQTAYQVRLKYLTDRKTAENESLARGAEVKAVEAKANLDLATQIDSRVKDILDRQALEIAALRTRVDALEAIEDEFRLAKSYMAHAGIKWPPPDDWPWPTT
jgi:hypothetical protein